MHRKVSSLVQGKLILTSEFVDQFMRALGTGHKLKCTGAGIDSGTMKFFRFIWVGHEISSVYLGGS